MNRQDFSQRVMAMEGRLYRISYGLLREEQDRRDAVQEAVVKAWQNVDKLRNEARFETWLTRILINECHNLHRYQRRFVYMDSVPEPVQVPDNADRILHDALMALEEKLRLPVMLFYMEGYKVREIAGILRLPEGTVKSRLRRAKAELKDMLSEPEE